MRIFGEIAVAHLMVDLVKAALAWRVFGKCFCISFLLLQINRGEKQLRHEKHHVAILSIAGDHLQLSTRSRVQNATRNMLFRY